MHLKFKNAVFQKQIEEQGYVQFPLLTKPEVEELLSQYKTGMTDEKSGFHCTMFSRESGYRKSVDKLIKESFSERLTDNIEGAKMLYANFMVKEPDEGSDFFVHQDWTYVDETKTRSWAIWVPLVDLTDENGALCVVPCSHRMKNIYRGPGIAAALDGLHGLIRNELGKPLKLKAGEAVVWDHRLVHYSPANVSSDSRVAATVVLVPEGEEVVHCRAEGGELEVGIYQTETEFYMNYEIEKGPASQPIRQVKIDRITYSENEFKQFADQSPEPTGLFRKVMNLFN